MLRRVMFWVVVAAAVFYALQGGEYGTDDILAQRARAARLRAGIDTLRREIDSLSQVKKSILTDAAVQERIAREEFGMVRGDKELLYRFAERRDSSATRPPSR